jgi:hypothetical protein
MQMYMHNSAGVWCLQSTDQLANNTSNIHGPACFQMGHAYIYHNVPAQQPLSVLPWSTT